MFKKHIYTKKGGYINKNVIHAYIKQIFFIRKYEKDVQYILNNKSAKKKANVSRNKLKAGYIHINTEKKLQKKVYQMMGYIFFFKKQYVYRLC